jgi:hypothetical protein
MDRLQAPAAIRGAEPWRRKNGVRFYLGRRFTRGTVPGYRSPPLQERISWLRRDARGSGRCFRFDCEGRPSLSDVPADRDRRRELTKILTPAVDRRQNCHVNPLPDCVEWPRIRSIVSRWWWPGTNIRTCQRPCLSMSDIRGRRPTNAPDGAGISVALG